MAHRRARWRTSPVAARFARSGVSPRRMILTSGVSRRRRVGIAWPWRSGHSIADRSCGRATISAVRPPRRARASARSRGDRRVRRGTCRTAVELRRCCPRRGGPRSARAAPTRARVPPTRRIDPSMASLKLPAGVSRGGAATPACARGVGRSRSRSKRIQSSSQSGSRSPLSEPTSVSSSSRSGSTRWSIKRRARCRRWE